MSRHARWAAWATFVVTGSIAVARLVLAIVDPASSDRSSGPTVPGGGVPVAVFEGIVLIGLATIGAVVASRQPRNVVGWILCVIPLSLAILIFCSHAFWAVTLGESEPSAAAAWVAWLASWPWVLTVIPTVTLFPLLVPTGRLLTPRWRPVLWLSIATIPLLIVTEAFRPGRLPEYPVDNPVGVQTVSTVFEIPGSVLMALTAIASIASLVVRSRRSSGAEREQLKWVAAGAIAFVAMFVLSASTQGFVGEDASFVVILLGLLLMAACVGVAMLRYRLYDIDVVINRALVYGSLTALLAGTYLGSVLLLQLLLERFTSGSGLAVAASTLATAALVRPARTRIQAVVDRRFFRRRYDAAQTLTGFSARVRQEVDLDALTHELRAVVAETMQPAHLSLWVPTRESPR